MRSSKTGLIIGLLIIIAIIIPFVQFWSAWDSATDKSNANDYLMIALTDLITDPVGLLFNQTEGSASFLKYWPLAFIWIWGSMLIRWRYKKYTYFSSTLSWSLIATGIVFLAWWWAAVVQYNGWYACYHNCIPGEAGQLDFTTHMATPAGLTAVLCTLDIMGALGLHGRLGRGVETTINYTLNGFMIPMWWEWQETLHPERYRSTYTNSITDILAALLICALVFFMYDRAVPYQKCDGVLVEK